MTKAEEFPIRGARFVNGRTAHCIRRPENEQSWHRRMEAACGKTGYLSTGYSMRPVTPCKGCMEALGGDRKVKQ